MRVLAFDPGYGITGWAVVEDPPLKCAGFGSIETDAKLEIHFRLLAIMKEASHLLDKFKPDLVVVETLFVHRNAKTAGSVYEARGVLLTAAAQNDLPVIHLEPNTIKKAVTGSGSAGKPAVHTMVQKLLSIKQKIRPDDAADALAGAIAGVFAAKTAAATASIRRAR